MKNAKAKKTTKTAAKGKDAGAILLREAVDRNTAALDRMTAALNEMNEHASMFKDVDPAPAQTGGEHTEGERTDTA